MTPEQAQAIFYEAAQAEYQRHSHNYTPVNQQKVQLAGYQAIIDAVTAEVDKDLADRYLAMQQFHDAIKNT